MCIRVKSALYTRCTVRMVNYWFNSYDFFCPISISCRSFKISLWSLMLRVCLITLQIMLQGDNTMKRNLWSLLILWYQTSCTDHVFAQYLVHQRTNVNGGFWGCKWKWDCRYPISWMYLIFNCQITALFQIIKRLGV